MLIMMCGVTTAFAADYNNISIQGQLTSPAPIYGVKVNILSGGAVVGTASDIALIPDTTDFIFSTQTYITNPWVFQTGSDYTMRLSSANGTVISTFSITAVPFALTVRGDAQTGDQNVFGAYGNVGIGTSTPSYRLVVSSAGTNLLWVSSAGVHATKYYGDGSALTGITGTGDNLGNHTATTILNMGGYNINAAGDISAARYQISGSTVLAVLGGSGSYGVGIGAGNSNTGSYNTFLGQSSGFWNTSGGSNTYLGAFSGTANTTGSENTIVGMNAGTANTTGAYNAFLGGASGQFNTTGWGNTFIGSSAGYNNTTGSYNIALGYIAGLSAVAYMRMNIGDLLYGDLLDGTVGIGIASPQAALDVVSTGTASNQFAQIWRNSAGTIVSSVSATGVMMASKFVGDGSGLTGIVATGGVLKTGDTMTGPLTLSGSSLTVTGNQTIADNLGIGIAAISGNSDRLYISGKTLSNTVLTLDATPASGGYGAQIKFKSKTAGGVDNQWDLGTAVSGSANALELYDGSALRMSIPIAGGVNLPAGAFSVGGSTLVVTGGRVGMGTSAPEQILHVVGNIIAKNTGSPLLVSESTSVDGNQAGLLAKGAYTNANWGLWTNRSDLGGVGDNLFFYKVDGTAGTKMVLTDSGNVGIGTTGPSSKLDVVGDVTVSSSMTVKGNDFGLGDYTSYNRQFEIKGGVAKAARIRFSQGSGSTDNWVIGAGGASETSAFEIYNGVGALPLQIDKVTSHTTIGNGLTVSSVTVTGNAQVNGNVGIGTASPSAKLQVSSGTIHIDGTGAPAIGGALCLNSTGNMSKCTSAIDSSGNCTCP